MRDGVEVRKGEDSERINICRLAWFDIEVDEADSKLELD